MHDIVIHRKAYDTTQTDNSTTHIETTKHLNLSRSESFASDKRFAGRIKSNQHNTIPCCTTWYYYIIVCTLGAELANRPTWGRRGVGTLTGTFRAVGLQATGQSSCLSSLGSLHVLSEWLPGAYLRVMAPSSFQNR